MHHKVKYLDPKNDITFRKIFGEHPHLLISFLNSMLPLEEDQFIEDISYLNPEIIPELPGFKRSIVDVQCIDNYGRYFLVEMQMYWTSSFMQRMIFNAGKAYVRQLKKGGKYSDLNPVYGLSLVDDIFHTRESLKKVYYHYYQFVHAQETDEQIKDLQLVFVELPKFKPQNYIEKRLQILWLRFLTEIDEDTEKVPDELLENEHIKEALEYTHKDAFTVEELKSYDEYWDAVRVEKAAIEELKERNEILEKEIEQAITREEEAKVREEEAKAREEEAKAREKEAISKLYKMVHRLKKRGFSDDEIAEVLEISPEEVKELLKNKQ